MINLLLNGKKMHVKHGQAQHVECVMYDIERFELNNRTCNKCSGKPSIFS